MALIQVPARHTSSMCAHLQGFWTLYPVPLYLDKVERTERPKLDEEEGEVVEHEEGDRVAVSITN